MYCTSIRIRRTCWCIAGLVLGVGFRLTTVGAAVEASPIPSVLPVPSVPSETLDTTIGGLKVKLPALVVFVSRCDAVIGWVRWRVLSLDGVMGSVCVVVKTISFLFPVKLLVIGPGLGNGGIVRGGL